MAKTPRLKVFAAPFGFHDSVVAASSQAKALEAWGIRQNLFAEGRATVSEDAEAIAAALAHPGVPLRRAVGSNEPFSLEPGLPDVPDPPKRKTADLKLVPKAKPPPEPVRPPPHRSALDAAEKALTAINARRIEDEADLARRREALEAQEAASRQRWIADRKAAEAALEKARRAYRAAGGEA